MCRVLFDGFLVFSLFGFLNSLSTGDKTCSRVKDEFTKIGSSELVPDSPIIDEGLRICAKTLTQRQASCCTQDTEMKYVLSSEKYLVSTIRSKNSFLKARVTDHVRDYKAKVLTLVQNARNRTNDILTAWFSVPPSESRLPIENFFSDIESRVHKQQHLDIYESAYLFFDNVFPLIFKHVIYRQPTETWTHHYHHCLAKHRQQIEPKPFGKFPTEIADKLSFGLRQVQAYLSAMELVIETINTTDNALVEEQCKHAVTRLQYCSHCQGFVGVKPCKGFCLHVMRGCLSKLAEIGPEWNDIITAVEGLVREMNDKSMDEVFKELVIGISDGIMHAMVSAPEFFQNVHDLCGIPLSTGDDDSEARTPDFSRTPTRHSKVSGLIAMDVMQVTLDLVDSKGLYSNLADDICADAEKFEQDRLSGTCWNGSEISVYVKEEIDKDILSQARNNPEVKVNLILDSNLRDLKQKMTLTRLALESSTGNSDNSRPRNSMVSDDPDLYGPSGDKPARGKIYTIGDGHTLTDDEDLYPYEAMSGSGSGLSSTTVDQEIDGVIDKDPPQLKPDNNHEGNLGPKRPTPKTHVKSEQQFNNAPNISISIGLLLSSLVTCIISLSR